MNPNDTQPHDDGQAQPTAQPMHSPTPLDPAGALDPNDGVNAPGVPLPSASPHEPTVIQPQTPPPQADTPPPASTDAAMTIPISDGPAEADTPAANVVDAADVADVAEPGPMAPSSPPQNDLSPPPSSAAEDTSPMPMQPEASASQPPVDATTPPALNDAPPPPPPTDPGQSPQSMPPPTQPFGAVDDGAPAAGNEPSFDAAAPPQHGGAPQPGQQPPMPSATHAPHSAAAGGRLMSGGMGTLVKSLAVALVVLVIAGGAYFALKDTLFGGSSISSSDLVSETAGGVSFKRPSQWTESSDLDNFKAAFSEDGKPIKNAVHAVAVTSGPVGYTYDELSSDLQKEVRDDFEEQFTNPEALEGDGCEDIRSVDVSEVSRDAYGLAMQVTMVCGKVGDQQTPGTLKSIFGLADNSLHVVAVIAAEETWNDSSDALDEILTTFTPE